MAVEEETNMSHLQMKDVSFRYVNQSSWVLNRVSLEVKSGTSVSILGPSGCGKSTLFYLLGGLYFPSEGEIWLDERKIKQSSMIGYMPQDSSLFPWMTVKQNVKLGYRLGTKQHHFALDDWLERADLTEVADCYPHQLSGGMQQRVSFLRVLASGQSLLCLDEPFASLDALTRSKMQKWLASFMQADQTFLLITHQIEEAVLLTDHIYLFPYSLEGKPIMIQNPFAKKDRFAMRQDPSFWYFMQSIEQRLQQQT